MLFGDGVGMTLQLVGLPAHPAVERGPELRAPRQVFPQRHAVRPWERRRAAHDAVAQPAPSRPHLRRADEQRPIANRPRPLAAEALAELGEDETPIRLLAEHPRPREHAQQPVQRLRIGAGGDRQFVDALRPVGQLVGNPECGGYMQALRGEDGVEHLKHPRRCRPRSARITRQARITCPSHQSSPPCNDLT
jgi:hypothetical protein